MDYRVSSILVAFDGSELSRKALQFAENIARTDESITLHLLTVKTPYYPVMYPGDYYAVDKKLLEDWDQQIKKTLDEAKAGLSIKNTVRTHIVTGSPAQAIVDFADRHDIDLIVMGSRGLGPVKEFFLGSVSHHVVQAAKCPVLIVK